MRFRSHRQRRLRLLVGLSAVAALTMGQGDCSVEEPQVERGPRDNVKERKIAPKTVSVGDKLTVSGTTYRVANAETAKSVGEGSTKTRANGQFVVISLSLTNHEDEPTVITKGITRLIGGNGESYPVSDAGVLALENQALLIEEIQPGKTEKGKLVYDVPKSAVNGSQLQVRDFFSEARGRFRLGL